MESLASSFVDLDNDSQNYSDNGDDERIPIMDLIREPNHAQREGKALFQRVFDVAEEERNDYSDQQSPEENRIRQREMLFGEQLRKNLEIEDFEDYPRNDERHHFDEQSSDAFNDVGQPVS
jgi:hypothetical protein